MHRGNVGFGTEAEYMPEQPNGRCGIVSSRSFLHTGVTQALRDFDDADWIRKRQALPRASATFAFNQDPARVRRADRAEDETDLQLWFGGPRGIEAREDVIGLGRFGKTLTVLHGIEPPDEAEDDEEALIESWTPRLRRR